MRKPVALKGIFLISRLGSDADLDLRSLAADNKLQQYIRKSVHSGMRLKLLKCPEGTKPYVVYRIVLERQRKRLVLGYTSKSFAHELEKGQFSI